MLFQDPLYATPLAFDIVTKEGAESADFSKRQTIPFGYKNDPKASANNSQLEMKQVSYNFGSAQLEVYLKAGVDYYIVPSLYKRNQGGDFCLFVYADCANFYLENSTSLMQQELEQPMTVGGSVSSSTTSASTNNTQKQNLVEAGVVLKMSKAQFYEKKELLRERIVSETKRLNLSGNQLTNMFQDVIKSNRSLSRMDFKRRMIDIGFNLSDFPDDDLIVLDENNDGSISPQEFIKFFEDGVKFVDGSSSNAVSVVVANKGRTTGGPYGIPSAITEKPVDDLLLKGLIDMSSSGILKFMLYNGRGIQKALNWYSKLNIFPTSAVPSVVTVAIQYNPTEAAVLRKQHAETKLAKLVTEKKVSLDRIGDLHRENEDNFPFFSATKTIKTENLSRIIAPFSPTFKNGFSSSLRDSAQLNSAVEPKTPEGIAISKSGVLVPGDVKAKSEKKKSFRNIFHDLETKEYLHYFPSRNDVFSKANIPLRQGSIGNNTEKLVDSFVVSSQIGKMETEHNSKSFSKLDFWDEILNRVMIVVSSRSEISASSGGAKKDVSSEVLKSNAYKSFLHCKGRSLSLTHSQIQAISNIRPFSALPSPAVGGNGLTKNKGHVPTPLSQRKIIASGTASIGGAGTATRHSSQNKAITSELLTNKLSVLQSEKQYEEIYRRLCMLPVVTQEDMAGERQQAAHQRNDCVSYLNYLLQSFDKTRTGYLSKDDFNSALQELLTPTSNAPYSCTLSVQDLEILSHRFAKYGKASSLDTKPSIPSKDKKASDKDITIDWKDFVSFFEDHVVTDGDRSNLYGESMLSKLINLKSKLPIVIQQMKERNLSSIEQFLDQFGKTNNAQSQSTAPQTNINQSASVISDQVIFQSLSPNQFARNHQILTALGFSLSVEDIARISRVFQYDLSLFMDFIRTSNSTNNANDLNDIEEFIDLIDIELAKELSIRGGMSIVRPCMSRAVRSENINGKSSSENLMLSSELINSVKNDSIKNCSIEGTEKIWQAFAPSNEAVVNFDILLQYCFDILQHSIFNKLRGDATSTASASTSASTSAAASDKASDKTSDKASTIKSLKFRGISVSILLGLILDTVFYSPWNRAMCQNHPKAHDENGTKVVDSLSFSGWDAFLRYPRYHSLEILLYYMYLQQENMHKEYVYLMVHVYLSHQQDELIIIAEDPLVGEVYTYKVADRTEILKLGADASKMDKPKQDENNSMKLLPYGKKLQELFQDKIPYSDLIQQFDKVRRVLGISEGQLFNQDSLFLYNPHDTPAEDLVISTLLSRCKLLTEHSSSSSGMNRFSRQLVLGEDNQIISDLKSILDNIAESLPFFFLLNDLVLLFEIDYNGVFQGMNVTSGGIRHFVFSHLRKHPSFVDYITKIQSTLTIVVSTYNHSYKESFDWQSMLSHMLQYCNTFVTLKLLPSHISPENYLYEKEEKPQNTTSPANDQDDDDETDEEGSATTKDKKVLPRAVKMHQSKVDYDGLPHPEWNEEFEFPYQSSKLTTCANLSTAVVKLQIEQKWKYVVVILRSGIRRRSKMLRKLNLPDTTTAKLPKYPEKESFYFLTVYDPRSSTEYQCGVNSKHDLYKRLYFHRQPNYLQPNPKSSSPLNGPTNNSADEIREIIELLEDCADQQLLILGPAITPRVELQVYNQNSKDVALLGQCQISISSVLSGSGVGEKAWVTLTLPVISADTTTNEANRQIATTNPKPGEKKLDPVIRCGEVQLELSFRRLLELEHSSKTTTNTRTNITQKQDSKVSVPNNPSTNQNKKQQLQHQDSKATVADVPSVPSDPSTNQKKQPVVVASESRKDSSLEAVITEKENEIKAMKAEIGLLKKRLEEALKTSSTSTPVPLVQENKLTAELLKHQEANLAQQKDIEKLQKSLRNVEKNKEEMDLQVKQLSKEKLDWKEKQQDYLKQIADLQEKLSEMQSTSQQPFATPLDSSATVVLQGSSSNKQVQRDCSSKNIGSHANVSETIQEILRVFISRYENRNSTKVSSNTIHAVLDTFQRLCYSFANPEGLLSIKELNTIFRELLIEVSIDDIGKIAQEVGTNSKHLLQVKHLLDIFYNELSQTIKLLKASGNGLKQSLDLSSSQQSLVVISDSENSTKPTAENPFSSARATAKSKKPTAPSVNSVESEDEEPVPRRPVQNKNVSSEKKNRPKSAAATISASSSSQQPRLPQLHAQTVSIGENDGANDVKAKERNARSQPLRSQSAHVPSKSGQEAEPSVSLPPLSNVNRTPTDWSKVPLPDHWERKFHKPSQRVSCVSSNYNDYY